jgi:hypothetical protein
LSVCHVQINSYVGDRQGVFAPGVELLFPLSGFCVEEVDLSHLRAGDDVLSARRKCNGPKRKSILNFPLKDNKKNFTKPLEITIALLFILKTHWLERSKLQIKLKEWFRSSKER